MSRGKAMLVGLFILAAFIGIGYGFYQASQVFFGALGRLDPDIAAAIVGAMGTTLGAVAGVIWNQRSLRKREIDEAHRPNKTKAYENFINNILIRILRDTQQGKLKQLTQSELQELFYEFTGDLIVWGSPSFIGAYQQFREAGQREDPTALLYMDDMLRAMRKDLGHSDWSVQRGDLIKLFLTDPQSVDDMQNA